MQADITPSLNSVLTLMAMNKEAKSYIHILFFWLSVTSLSFRWRLSAIKILLESEYKDFFAYGADKKCICISDKSLCFYTHPMIS